jgi:hypothetical protein
MRSASYRKMPDRPGVAIDAEVFSAGAGRAFREFDHGSFLSRVAANA